MSSQGKEEIYSLISELLNYRKLKNYAPGGIANTGMFLKKFAWYLEENGFREIRSITKADLSRFLQFLQDCYKPRRGERLTDITIRAWWGTILLFFDYLTSRGYLLHNPALCVERPKVSPAATRKPLALWEVERLLSQPDLHTKNGIRNRAILELFYSTGIRRGELLGLEIFDADLREKTLRVRKAKGGKERLVPFGEEAAFYLKRYLDEVRAFLNRKHPDEKALFLNQYGRPLNSTSLQCVIQKCREHSGIRKKITPHILRHTFATHLFEGGADIFSIRDLLGHERVETTQIYTKTTFSGLKNAHRSCHPRG